MFGRKEYDEGGKFGKNHSFLVGFLLFFNGFLFEKGQKFKTITVFVSEN